MFKDVTLKVNKMEIFSPKDPKTAHDIMDTNQWR
jgi:hypothetical protein